VLTYSDTSKVISSSLLSKNIVHGFGTRMSGNGRDVEDIRHYLTTHNVTYKTIVDPEQVHGDHIVHVTSDNSKGILDIDECDGLITSEKGVALTVITADCAPILYLDLVKNIVGISHNGRKGTELKLAMKMIDKLYALGSKSQDIRVAIGPAIGACCYPMNLLEDNVKQLLESGLGKEQIDTFPFCTKCYSKRFYSYRNSRDLPFESPQDKTKFPEQFSFIMLNNA